MGHLAATVSTHFDAGNAAAAVVYHDSLVSAGIPVQMKLYDHGPYGFGLANGAAGDGSALFDFLGRCGRGGDADPPLIVSFGLMQKVFAGSRHSAELEFMYRVILEAGKLLLAGRVNGTEVSYKSDNSIVTQIDHQCAAYLDGEIAIHFPGDSILNEETWHLNPAAAPWHQAERCWILDPLDSTSSYIRNGQHYGVIMALAIQGRPEAGMTYKPELGEIYFAVKGEGAFRAFVSAEPELVEVIPVKVSQESRPSLITSHGRLSKGLNDLLRQLGNPPSHRMNGSLKINEVARGAYTAFVSPKQNPMALWDMGATQLILEEAGGRLTDLQGNRLDFRSPNPILTCGIIASNGVTHMSLLDKLRA